MISALAAGADQIAIETHLARAREPWLDCPYEVVIPFDIESYATTIEEPGSALRMRDLAREARSCMIVADGKPNAEKEKDSREARWRNLRFSAVGDILVRQADVLLAVWDGNFAADMGGTTSVIAGAIREGVPVLWVHASLDHVWLLAVDRQHGDGLMAAVDSAKDIESLEGLAAFGRLLNPLLRPEFSEHAGAHDIDAYPKSLSSFRRFFGPGAHVEPVVDRTPMTIYRWALYASGSNAPMAELAIEGVEDLPVDELMHVSRTLRLNRTPGLNASCDNVATWMQETGVSQADQRDPFGSVSAHLYRTVGRQWVAIDMVASRLGDHYRSSYVGTFLAAAAAVVVSLIGIFFHEHEWIFVAIEMLLLVTAIFAFLYGRMNKIHDRWLVARNLEEQFRPAWALAQLGLGGRRVLQHPPAPWSAWAIQAWIGRIGVPNVVVTPDYLTAVAVRIRKDIVVDQFRYHVRNATRLRFLHHGLEAVGHFAFLLSPWAGVFFLAHEGADKLFDFHSGFLPHIPQYLLVLGGAALPAVAAAVAGLRYQGDFLRFAARSQRTAKELQTINAALRDYVARVSEAAPESTAVRGAFSELRDILLNLEAILIDDLEDWRYVYSARPNPEP